MFLVLIMLMSSTHTSYAQLSVESLIAEGRTLITQMNEEEALQKYLAVIKIEPNNYEANWQTSFLLSKIGNRQTDTETKKQYFISAKVYAQKALVINPTDAESNYVMAVAMGRMALISGPKDKVAASRDIKNYADLAVKYNPTHAGAWHVLGKWNYEVANLNFAEKAAANTLFGGLPDGADVPEAIACYKKAIQFDPTYILYYLDLAIAYDNIHDSVNAIATLKTALTLKPTREDDQNYLKQCSDMLSKLQK